MNHQATLVPAYVLHSRLYRDTSLLVELFTKTHGRISGIARGVRQKKSSTRGLLQLFTPILVSWAGRGELSSIRAVEPNGCAAKLVGKQIYSAMYLNELLVRSLERDEAYPLIYQHYAQALQDLASGLKVEITLRLFEKQLLQALGYGLQILHEAGSGWAVEAERHYSYSPDHGLTNITGEVNRLQEAVFLGRDLLAIAQDDYSDPQVLRAAKRLMRLAFGPLLGQKNLKSRELFI